MADLFSMICLNAAFWAGVSVLVASRARPDWVDRVFVTAVTGFSAIVVTLELFGLAGQINRISVAMVCIATALAGLWHQLKSSPHSLEVSRVARRAPQGAFMSRRSAPSLIAIGLAVWAALVYLLLGLLLPVEPISDAPIYHLFFAAQWWKAGSLPFVPTPFGEEGATYFPANGNLWFTWLMATGSDGPVVKTGQWPFLVLGALALYGIARRARAPWPAAILPAALWTALPIVLTQSSLANVDLIWTAFYLIAVYFLLGWIEDGPAHDRTSILFFALACGIVIGSKTVGAVFVALLLPLILAAPGRHPLLRQLTSLAIGLVLPAAYWYARNMWATGNPVYPLQLSLFGRVLADGWYRAAAMDATAYHLPQRAWPLLAARLALVSGTTGLILVVAGMVAGWTYAVRRSVDPATRRVLAVASALALAHTIVYWCVQPYNTQERFLSPALGLALVPLSIVTASSPLLQGGLCALLAWQLLGTWSGDSAFTLLRLYDNPLSLGNIWLTLVLPVSILAAALALRSAARARWVLAGTSLVLGCYFSARPIAASLGEQPLLRFYPRAGFAASLFPGWEILERAASPGGSRIAYTGTNLPYYLLGIGLRNQVQYVNINSHADWLPHDFHRDRLRTGRFQLAPDPWPQWYRSEADFDAWVANLRGTRIDFLFVARENRHGRLESTPGELPRFPIEREWADAHPNLFVDLGPSHYAAGTIPWVRVYRVTPAP